MDTWRGIPHISPGHWFAPSREINLIAKGNSKTSRLPDLPHQHRPNPKSHDEEAAESVEQIGPAFELGAVGVNDGDRDNANETIEGVELGEFELVAVDHDDTKDHLDEHRGLGKGDIPPKTPGPEGLNLVGSQRPDAGETVADDDDPGPVFVQVDQC